MITHLAQPLADISELISDNMNILERHENHLRIHNMGLEELKKQLYMPVINLEVVKQTRPVTVCTSRSCSEIYKVSKNLKRNKCIQNIDKSANRRKVSIVFLLMRFVSME